MPQNIVDKIKDLTHDPIGIGILAAAALAVFSLIFTTISLFRKDTKDEIATTPTEVETNVEPTGDPADIGDKVWLDINRNGTIDEGEQGVAGLTVHLIDFKTKEAKLTTQTDSMGNYKFSDVVPGEYEIEIQLPLNLIPTSLEAGENRETDSNISLVEESELGLGRVGRTNSFVLSDGIDNLSIDAGVHSFEEISGIVWIDTNADNLKGDSDIVVPGIIVSLLNDKEEVVDSKVTDENGAYSFTAITPGAYSVKFESNQDYSTQNPTNTSVTLQQLTSTPQYTDIINLQSEQKINDINQMMYNLTSEIKLQVVNREREAETQGTLQEPTPTAQPTTEVETQSEGETTPAATPTLEAVTEEPAATPTTQTADDTSGSGSAADATTEVQSEGTDLVRTGLPIFILALLGGANLLIVKYANTDKSEADMRKRKARRYSNRL